jgi:hypothetical protein
MGKFRGTPVVGQKLLKNRYPPSKSQPGIHIGTLGKVNTATPLVVEIIAGKIELLGTQRAVAAIDSIDMPIGEKTMAKDVFYFLEANFPGMDLDDKKGLSLSDPVIIRE